MAMTEKQREALKKAQAAAALKAKAKSVPQPEDSFKKWAGEEFESIKRQLEIQAKMLMELLEKQKGDPKSSYDQSWLNKFCK